MADELTIDATAKKRRISRRSWKWGDALGEGSYAIVREAEMVEESHPFFGKKYAIKVVDKRNLIRNKKQKYVAIEKKVFLTCKHTNILKLRFTFQDEASLYFVMDLCDGELGELIRERSKLPLKLAQLYTAEITSALEHLHDLNIVHRDLKPENCLIKQNGHIALTDFGTAKFVNDEPKKEEAKELEPEDDSDADPRRASRSRTRSFVGTATYVSPELLNNAVDNLYSLDFWSLGCLVFCCLVGNPPFEAATEYLTFQAVLKDELKLPKNLTKDAKSLITALLNRDAPKRLGVCGNGIKDLKAHPFFKGLDFEKVNDVEVPSLPPIAPLDENTSEATLDRWMRFLEKDEKIVHGGEVEKPHRKILRKRRTLLLTDRPRFIFVNTDAMTSTKDIQWSKDIEVKLSKDDQDSFSLTTSKKVYQLKAITGDAKAWKQAIDKMLK